MGITLPPLCVLLRDALGDYRPALPVIPDTYSNRIEPPPLLHQAGIRTPDSTKKGNDDVTLFPRRKAGQGPQQGGRGPVIVSVELLEQFYGMPLHLAAKKLGICQTAIKKVCRRLGIKKWPYKDTRVPVKREEPSVPSVLPIPDYIPSPHSAGRHPLNHEFVFYPSSCSASFLTDTIPPIKAPGEEASAIHTLLSLKAMADMPFLHPRHLAMDARPQGDPR